MNTYLAIITTVLVITQVIRVTQNTVQLFRQNVLFKKELKQLADFEITEEDMINRVEFYKLANQYLRDRVQEKHMVYSAKSGTENEKM